MYTTCRKSYKDFLEKLAHFVVEDFYDQSYFLDFNAPIQIIIGIILKFAVELWWEEVWSTFDWWVEYQPNPAIIKNHAAPKFSRPIRLLDLFTQNFSRKVLSFQFIFCVAVQHHDWSSQNKFWLLKASGVLS